MRGKENEWAIRPYLKIAGENNSNKKYLSLHFRVGVLPYPTL